MGKSKKTGEVSAAEEPRERTSGIAPSGLMVEPVPDATKDEFHLELGRSLDETERHINHVVKEKPDTLKTWRCAREVVEKFKPVPWFIWRISNYVFSRSGQINSVPEGMIMGLRRLLFAAASDLLLGSGKPVSNLKVATSLLRSDVIAAVSVVHAVCRRLATKEFERIWRPIIDDALLRAQIGYYVGRRCEHFGAGRGMLAGFAGRAGLAILIASGDLQQARHALEELAAGRDIGEVGLELYGCDPLQVSALMLSASGCGKDAAFGVVTYVSKEPLESLANNEQRAWLAAFTVCEKIRLGQQVLVPSDYWQLLEYTEAGEREQLVELAKTFVREGTNWAWIA
jgi:hypothetical protein